MFLYEMHMHTKEVSACARTSAVDMVKYYKDLGFTGIFITDHFFNGNTTVDRSLPWEQRVKEFAKGYHLAKSEGDRIGLDVFFAWEYSYHGNDFLTYGLDEQWLISHPEVMDMSLTDYCDFARAEGGFVIHAHPLREAFYIDMIRLIPRNVDGVEIYNANRTDFENDAAKAYAKRYELLKIAGSDNHTGEQEHIGAMKLPKRIVSDNEMIEAIRQDIAELVRVY